MPEGSSRRRGAAAAQPVSSVGPQRRALATASVHQIAAVDARYLSVALDLGQVAEPTRFWNPKGHGETDDRRSFDFSRSRLRKLAGALAPCYLRVGGTEADRCLYALDASADVTELVRSPPPPFTSVLTAAHVDAIGQFAQACKMDIAFTLNAGWGARAGNGGPWDPSRGAIDLMRLASSRGYPFEVYELGNEPNAWPLFHRGLTVQPEEYARDLATLIRTRDAEAPLARVSGGSTAFWPNLGECPALGRAGSAPLGQPTLIRGFLRRALSALGALDDVRAPDIITWHYYPGLSDRSKLAKHRTAAGIAGVAAVGALIAMAISTVVSIDGESTMAPPTRTWLQSVAWLFAALVAALVALVGAILQMAIRPVTPTSLRRTENLDTVVHWSAQVERIVDEAAAPAAPRPALWLGETGSAQVGGQPEVSGRWASTLWWLDQLGALAKRGTAVQCRQTLAGADYGLLDEETLEPTPDYWASLLWRRCMGTAVHETYTMAATPEGTPLFRSGSGTTEADTAALSKLRVYCHSGAPSAAAAASVDAELRERLVEFSFLALNLGTEEIALDVRVNGYEAPDESGARGGGGACRAAVWVLDAPSLSSRVVSINGIEPRVLPDGSPPELPPETVGDDGYVIVPAGAATFVRLALARQQD